MPSNQIQNPPILPHMPKPVKDLRKNAGNLLKLLVADSRDLTQDSIQLLEGGMLSAVYFFKKAGQVVKFRFAGTSAEAEALKAWAIAGANVTDVSQVGIVKQKKSNGSIVKYTIQEGVWTGKRLAPTAQDFVNKYPDYSFRFGQLLGEQLALMHHARSERTFGEYLDMVGTKAPFKTWNAYLLSYLNHYKSFLPKLGIRHSTTTELKVKIKQTQFHPNGVYAHGDFGLRNALVESRKPLKIKIIDPNPIIGDRSWDIAILYNNFEFAKHRRELKKNSQAKLDYFRDKRVLEGFLDAYEKKMGKIDRTKVALSQIMQILMLTKIEIRKARAKGISPNEEIEVKIRRQTLMDNIHYVLKQ